VLILRKARIVVHAKRTGNGPANVFSTHARAAAWCSERAI
jgi:hypothetical protein